MPVEKRGIHPLRPPWHQRSTQRGESSLNTRCGASFPREHLRAEVEDLADLFEQSAADRHLCSSIEQEGV